jgi:hypothetical protein
MSTFATAKAAGLRIIARAVTAKTMPAAGALDAISIDLLQTWATKGYPQAFVAAPVVTPPVAAPVAAVTATFADIAKLMKEKTFDTCHSTSTHQAGAILDTQAGYDVKAAVIPVKLKAAHIGIVFDAAQLKLTGDYAANLTVAKPSENADPTTAAETETASETSTIPAECKGVENASGSTVTGIAAADSDFAKVLNPPQLTACHEKKVIFDRRTKACHVATLGGDYTCDWPGIKVKFKDIATPETLQGLEDAKWQVDQCGIDAGSPVVFLIQPDSSGGFLNIGIKVLSVE